MRGRSDPRIAGDYELLEPIDDWGLCAVRRARHVVTGHEVAVKIWPARTPPRDRARVEHQVHLLSRVDHVNVIRTFGSGELDGGAFYLLIETLDGVSLSRLLRDHGPLPLDRALRSARQIALGVRGIHEAGGILRDVKPSIIWTFPDRRDTDEPLLKIVDLSCAEVVDGSLAGWAKPETTIGTPPYMSPEQWETNPPPDLRSDIYNFGVVLFELVSGRRPFQAETLSGYIELHCQQQPPPSLRSVADVPTELDALVLACMAKSAADRPQNMTHVIDALDRVLAL